VTLGCLLVFTTNTACAPEDKEAEVEAEEINDY
jgi:hypothetical protein